MGLRHNVLRRVLGLLFRNLPVGNQRGSGRAIAGGTSGTGKSTLLHIINHLEEPDGGSILFEGEDTLAAGYDYNRLRESIGMVFQSFNLLPHLTVVENLMLAQTELLKRDVPAACAKSMELLHMVGLSDITRVVSFHGLTGGTLRLIELSDE